MAKEKIINGGGASTQSNSIDSKSSVLSGYSLTTSAQTIVGAINEILPKATGVGKVDPNSDGTGEIFNLYEGEYANVASGPYSHAEGISTTAEGICSHAEGSGTKAEGNYSHAEGRHTIASGEASHAEGQYTTASGSNSHAEGSVTNASGSVSHAEGRYTTALNSYEHAEGSYNVSNTGDTEDLQTRHSVGIGSDSSHKNAHEIMANGDHYVYGLGGYDGTNAISEDSKTLQEVINSKQATITPGTGLEFEGNTLNVTLDTTVFKVVSALPDSPAQGDENKIHLVPAESTGANNAYTEYVWVNSAWEILGEYTSEVDLTPYLKTVDAESTYLKITDAESEYATKTELADKQNATDQSLQTTDKTVVGAINEVKLAVDNIKYPFPSDDSSYTSALCIDIDNVENFNTIKPLLLKGIDILHYKSKYYQIFSCSWSDGYYWIYARSLTDWNTILIIDADVVKVVDTKVYQKTEDESLLTNSKTVSGAINEILPKATGVGKVDPDSDGTGEIFNTYSGMHANHASGSASHSEGQGTTASGSASHSEGYGTTASGNYAHAEGNQSTAPGFASHAEGYSTTASGSASHSEGQGTTASGNYAHAEGYYTQSKNHYEHAEGCYNLSNSSTEDAHNTRHSVGIGNSDSNRKNAHEIMANGDHYVYGLGGYDGTNATSEDSKTLQTVVTELQTSLTTIQSKQTVYTEVPELTAAYTIPANATMVEKIYMITIGATVYDVTGDSAIKWAGGVTPTASANSILVVSVLNNLATWQTFI